MKPITQLNPKSSNGIYTFETESGSNYTLNIKTDTVTLLRQPKDDPKNKLRKDNEEIRVKDFTLEEGKLGLFKLEPLGDGDLTIRKITTVTNIKEEKRSIPHLNKVNGKIEIDPNDPKQVKWFEEYKKER